MGKAVHPGSVALYPTLTDISYMFRELRSRRFGASAKWCSPWLWRKAHCVPQSASESSSLRAGPEGFLGFHCRNSTRGLEYLLVTSRKTPVWLPFRTSQEWLPDLHGIEHTWSILTKPRSSSWVVAVGRNLGRGEPFGELLVDVQEFRRSILAHG